MAICCTCSTLLCPTYNHFPLKFTLWSLVVKVKVLKVFFLLVHGVRFWYEVGIIHWVSQLGTLLGCLVEVCESVVDF